MEAYSLYAFTYSVVLSKPSHFKWKTHKKLNKLTFTYVGKY